MQQHRRPRVSEPTTHLNVLPDSSTRRQVAAAYACRNSASAQAMRSISLGSHALVRGVDQGERLLDAHQDQLGVGVGLREHVAQRDRAALAEERHGPARTPPSSPRASPRTPARRCRARNGDAGRLGRRRSTATPHGAAARRCSLSARLGLVRLGARAGSAGSAGRSPRARSPPLDPTTGGQSMPRMVTAGRAQSMSETVPEPSSDSPSAMPTSLRKASVGYGAPVHTSVLSRPVIVVFAGFVAQRGEHRDQGGQRVRRGAAEHARVELRRQRRHLHDDVDHAAQADRQRPARRRPRCRCRRPGWRRRAAGRRGRARSPRGRRCPAPRSPRRPASG